MYIVFSSPRKCNKMDEKNDFECSIFLIAFLICCNAGNSDTTFLIFLYLQLHDVTIQSRMCSLWSDVPYVGKPTLCMHTSTCAYIDGYTIEGT